MRKPLHSEGVTLEDFAVVPLHMRGGWECSAWSRGQLNAVQVIDDLRGRRTSGEESRHLEPIVIGDARSPAVEQFVVQGA